MSRNTHRVLSETYNSLYESKTSRQTPFSEGELKALKAFYKFKPDPNNPSHIRRIAAMGDIENVYKYSDGTYIKFTDDNGTAVRTEYVSFTGLLKGLTGNYKAPDNLQSQELPKGDKLG